MKYGKLTRRMSPHVVGPSGARLSVPPDLAAYAFPLLEVDLADCTDDLTGRLQFVYVEYAESTRDGRAEGLTFHVDASGCHTLAEESAARLRRFVRDVSLPTSPPPRKWRGAHLELEIADVTTPTDPFATRAAIREREGGRDDRYPLFGGPPLWIQPSRSSPLDPDGRPMRFIGQVCAAYFTSSVADFELMLFYAPEHHLVVQYAQNS